VVGGYDPLQKFWLHLLAVGSFGALLLDNDGGFASALEETLSTKELGRRQEDSAFPFDL
jgi:hypothetical protein